MFLECIGGTEWLTGCGDVCIPAAMATYTRMIYSALRIITPLVLIIIGMYDMAKAVTVKNADDIKKAQNLLVKKAIAAAIVFFLFTLVSWMIQILADTGTPDDKTVNEGIIKCLEQLFISDPQNSIEKEEGIKQGVTDPGALCRSYDFTEYMLVCNEDCSEYFYTCSTVYKEDTQNKCSSGKLYKLGDGDYYCLTKFSAGTTTGAVFTDGDKFEDYGPKVVINAASKEKYSSSSCKDKCGDAYRGVLIVARNENACLCIKK